MFGGSEKRKGFVRTKISPVERILSWVLLGLIGGIGLAIYDKGQNYDPALFALEQSALSKSSSAPAEPEPPVVQDEGPPSPPAIGTDTPPSAAGLLEGLTLEGWRAQGQIEQFTPESLYEKINGRAEQYLAYDVVGLACVGLVNSADRFIDIFVYNMGRPTHAFGIYSVERSEDQPVAALGREGYCVAASCFFWKGPYYVQIIASDTAEPLQRIVLDLARALAGQLLDGGEPIWGLTALPEADRVPGTVQYFMRDALSLDFLGNTYTARYRVGDGEVTAFLSKQPSPNAAEETLANYLGYLNEYGSTVGRRQVNSIRLTTGDMGGFFDVVFQKGTLVGGVTMAEDRALAEQVAAEVLAAVQGP